jgi:hypothetical protein
MRHVGVSKSMRGRGQRASRDFSFGGPARKKDGEGEMTCHEPSRHVRQYQTATPLDVKFLR